MSDERDGYEAYLLRLWRVWCQGRWQWRASLESPRTAERQVFASLQQLYDFLSERYDRQEMETGTRGDMGKARANGRIRHPKETKGEGK